MFFLIVDFVAVVQARDGVELTVERPAEFFDRGPGDEIGAVAVERVVGEDVLVDDDVGGELATGGGVSRHAVRAVGDGRKPVEFGCGANLVAAINEFRCDGSDGWRGDTACHP